MTEQLRIEGAEVPYVVGRIRATTALAGKRGIAECRAVLAAASTAKCHRGCLSSTPVMSTPASSLYTCS